MATDLELEVSRTRPDEYEVRVVHAAAGGEPSAALQLDVDGLLNRRAALEATVLASSVQARRAVSATEEPVRQVGQQLFEALFTGPVYGTYRASSGVAQERQQRLRIILRLKTPELALLPWETLFDPDAEVYLCRQEPLVRHVPARYTPEPLQVKPPLRILAVIASPRGLPLLDTDAERGRLEEALAEQIDAGRVELTWVPQASWDRVHGRLLEGEWHVLHFIGHGDYDESADEGLIALVDSGGGADLVEASRLADLLGEARPTPRLVVLNSCASAQGGTRDVFSSTGATLVRSGISAAAAMQFTVSDRAAIRFAHGFYAALAHGRRIDEAAQSGRIAILGTSRRTLEWITPVLYVRGDTTQLFTFTAESPSLSVPDPPPGGRRDVPLRALYVRAAAEVRVGRHSRAIELLDDLLMLDPDNPDAVALRDTAVHQRRLAEAYEQATDAEAAGDWAAAIDAYTEILRTDQGYLDAVARRESCRARQHIADLEAELRYHADAGRWQAVIQVSEDLHGLDPAAADPDGLATHARRTLREAEHERLYAEARRAEDAGDWAVASARYGELAADGGYRDAAQRRAVSQEIDELRTALHERVAAQDWVKVLETITKLTVVQAPTADEYAALADLARREITFNPPKLASIDFEDEVLSLSWDPAGQSIAVAGKSRWARVYDTSGAERLKVKGGSMRSVVSAVAFSADGYRIATGNTSRAARVWDAATGRLLLEVSHGACVNALAFSPEGARFATGGSDAMVRVWDVTGIRENLLDLRHGGDGWVLVNAVAFSPEGARFATGGSGATARVWDATTGRQLVELRHGGGVNAVAFSPDGARIATGSDDHSARVWDAATGRQLLAVRHGGGVNAVAFSPDGARIATGSDDHSARVWDAATGRQLLAVRHGAGVNAVAFSPDGTLIATGSGDHTACLWPVGDL
ncbi:CHAT domain-containing protein [Streptomyces sp. NBC_00193]|uniref:CHAT domain-containing WD40 repeat protein n=1 Tax=Streptomyces sp. NBC_00193 TaxID=2975675 RepID=UPI00225B8864|nr:CHAT domain-containing protein [Streptomyces sp. NBC_00193]MCX5300200.1 CHAT domain-containing protein [Streptomyces sp. NBC_00193]